MLYSIKLHNFLSYEDASVVIDGARMLSIVGDNGQGKSAFLEAIPYAYFGIGRGTLSELSRIEGDGSHSVILTHHNLPMDGDTLIIERGRNKSGKGFIKVHVNNKLYSEGAEANKDIIELLGMNAELFMLTAFFGLGDDRKSDTLIKVGPAERLETLQKLANVSIYKEFYKRADADYKAKSLQLSKQESVLETLESLHVDTKQVQSDLYTARDKREILVGQLQDLQTKKMELAKEEDQHIIQLRRKSVLETELKAKQDVVDQLEMDISGTESTITELNDSFITLEGDIITLKQNLERIDADGVNDAVANNTSEIIKDTTLVDLKVIAVENVTDDVETCPLCGHALDAGVLDHWKEDIRVLRGKIHKLQGANSGYKRLLREYQQMQNELTSLESKLVTNRQLLETHTNSLKGYKRDLKVAKSEYHRVNTEYQEIVKKVTERTVDVTKELNAVEAEINTVHRKLGDIEAVIIQCNSDLKEAKTRESKIQKVKHNIHSLEKDLKVLSVLQKAFHRYGIPLTLLRTMNKRIGEFATQVYQEFNSGVISLEETQGARPGIEFVLTDGKGARRWGLLSLGEKVMFFVAVRVALTKVVSGLANTHVDFVVLDEIMGNLSPAKQEAMVRVISKILRKVFPQVLMVSHTPMNDIFDRVYNVVKPEGVSLIEEV